MQPSFEVGGTAGKFSLLHHRHLCRHRSRHRATDRRTDRDPRPQRSGLGFGYFSYVLGSATRAQPDFRSGCELVSDPRQSGSRPGVHAGRGPAIPVEQVAESQMERTFYNIVALQGAVGRAVRLSDRRVQTATRCIDFSPDNRGDLIYNGTAAKVFRSSLANGLQGDAAYRHHRTHTLRAGFYGAASASTSTITRRCFPTDDMGDQPATADRSSTTRTSPRGSTASTSRMNGGRSDTLTINYGVRLRPLTMRSCTPIRFSPRLGAVYEMPTQTTSCMPRYARYFTPPQASWSPRPM